MARYRVTAGAAVVAQDKGERMFLRGVVIDEADFRKESIKGLADKGILTVVEEPKKPAAKQAEGK